MAKRETKRQREVMSRAASLLGRKGARARVRSTTREQRVKWAKAAARASVKARAAKKAEAARQGGGVKP